MKFPEDMQEGVASNESILMIANPNTGMPEKISLERVFYPITGGTSLTVRQVESARQTNGLDFLFTTRQAKEIDAMSIIQEIYLSVLDANIDVSIGVSISALSIRKSTQGGYEFALQLVPSNVSADNQNIIHFTRYYTELPTNVEELYTITNKCKLYIRVDFPKLGLRDIVYNWKTPICKVVNIIDKDADFWLRQSYNPTSFASKAEIEAVNTALEPVKTVEPIVPAFDFNTPLDQGFYEVYNNKVRVSTIVPAQYRHIKLSVPLDRKMRVTLKPYGIIVYSAIYTDVTDTYISKEIKGEDNNKLYENYDLTIPEKAVYIYLSGHATSSLEAYVNGLDVVSRSVFETYVNTTGCETKTMLVSGDSITSPPDGWVSVVKRELKFANIINGAVGSSCWSKRRQTLNDIIYETQDYNDPNFAGISSGWQTTTDPVEVQKRVNNCSIVHIQKVIKEIQEKKYPIPDMAIIAYGTNSDTALGDAQTALDGKGLDTVDLFTMAGAIRWCIQTLLTEYPSINIFISLPIQTGKPANNIVLEQKMPIMKDVCKGMSATFFDCYSESGICEKFEKSDGTEGRYLRDSLHENAAGVQVHGNYKVMMLKRYI